jgi:signal transduction histidine kinase/CheY-like chemotaxis protein
MNFNVLPDDERVVLLLNDAYVGRVNDINKSIATAEKALEISRKIDNHLLIGKSLNQLSLYYMIISDFEKSTKNAEEAILYYKKIEDEGGIADAKYNIGSIHYKTNNYHLGLVYLLDSLSIYRKTNDLFNQSKVEKAIGTIYEYIGDDYNAFKSYKSAIKIAIKIGEANLESNVYNNLSGLFLNRKKPKLALAIIEYSIKLKKQTNDIRGYGFAIYGLGKVHYYNGEYDLAEQKFLEAVDVHKSMGEKMGVAMAYTKLGQLYFNRDLLDKAESIAFEGLQLSIQYNMSMIKVKNYHLLYLIFKKRDDKVKALEYLEFYLKEKESAINAQTLKVIENYELINKMNALEREAQRQKEKQHIIDKKNQDEKESMRLKQEFLSIMSHEIRTPLNAITTIVSMFNTKVDYEGLKMLKSLQFASNNLISIVNDILDYTKLDLKKAKLELTAVNFKQLFDNILSIYEGMAKEKGIFISLNTNINNSKTYLIDETKFTQIMSNLISNAIKFTDQGKVEITTQLIEETKTHDTILFKVSDSGVGMKEKDLSKIFTSFSQLTPVMTRKQGGTGLGLAIVKKLVELHNSEIKVTSSIGVGSEFYFKLKLEKTIQKVIEIKPNFDELKGKKALLAEDTPMNALLMTKLLSKWGISSDHVVNGNEAFEQAKLKKYDFILMDIHMPEMNGFEATQLIKSYDNLNSDTPIFALTADVTVVNDDKNKQLFNGFLWKPFEIDKLYAALAHALASPIVS